MVVLHVLPQSCMQGLHGRGLAAAALSQHLLTRGDPGDGPVHCGASLVAMPSGSHGNLLVGSTVM
jgi:hypothetical protein